MAISYSKGKTTATARTRIFVAALFGIAVAIGAGIVIDWSLAPLLGWDAAALVFLIWIWLTIYRLPSNLTDDFARREDPSRKIADVILLLASIASLGAVLQVLFSTDSGSLPPWLQVTLGILSIATSWALVHTIFMLRYAEMYYKDEPHGVIDFPGTKNPTFRDFAYVAFTIGMTYQVSDTSFTSSEFRGVAIRHALISYVFGTVIVATTINLIVSLGK